MRKRELIERLSVVEGQLGQVIPNYILATERLADLELDLEDIGWERLTGGQGREFSREAIRSIGNKALLYYAKNPIINHGIEVQGHYVFGQGVTITGESDEVDKLWRLFWDDPKNRAELTTPSALFLKEVDLQIEGNIFLSLFTSNVTGAVRVRSIHSNEIIDIVTNREDSKEPWFYRRRWAESDMSTEGEWAGAKPREEFYPAWNYRPKNKQPMKWGKVVNWDAPIYHIKAGGTSSMRFGVPEVYSALDWAKAAKESMEDYATVRSAHARFADTLVTRGGPAGVAAAKAKLATTIGGAGTGEETVPSATAGSTFVGAEGWKLEVFRTSGAQAHPEEARYLFVMAGAGMGLSYSILMGDADKSNLATATSLDRPIELRMQMRRMLWTTVFGDLATYLLMAAARAIKPAIQPKPKMVEDEWGTEKVELGKDKEGDPIPTGVVVSWPSILEHDVDAAVKALVSAFTRDGKADAGLFPEEVQVRELATALGIEDVDTIIDEMIAAAEEAPPAEDMEKEDQFIDALKEVQKVLQTRQIEETRRSQLHAKEQNDGRSGKV